MSCPLRSSTQVWYSLVGSVMFAPITPSEMRTFHLVSPFFHTWRCWRCWLFRFDDATGRRTQVVVWVVSVVAVFVFFLENAVAIVAVKLTVTTTLAVAACKLTVHKHPYIVIPRKSKCCLTSGIMAKPISDFRCKWKIVHRGFTRNPFFIGPLGPTVLGGHVADERYIRRQIIYRKKEWVSVVFSDGRRASHSQICFYRTGNRALIPTHINGTWGKNRVVKK